MTSFLLKNLPVIASLSGALVFYKMYKFVQNKRFVTYFRKAIFITGCDTGFGYLLAKRLGDMGIVVFAACYTDDGRERLENEYKENIITVKVDVSDTESIREAFDIVSLNVKERDLSK